MLGKGNRCVTSWVRSAAHTWCLAWLLVTVLVGRESGAMQNVNNPTNRLFGSISAVMNRQKAGCSELQTTGLLQLWCWRSQYLRYGYERGPKICVFLCFLLLWNRNSMSDRVSSQAQRGNRVKSVKTCSQSNCVAFILWIYKVGLNKGHATWHLANGSWCALRIMRRLRERCLDVCIAVWLLEILQTLHFIHP